MGENTAIGGNIDFSSIAPEVYDVAVEGIAESERGLTKAASSTFVEKDACCGIKKLPAGIPFCDVAAVEVDSAVHAGQ